MATFTHTRSGSWRAQVRRKGVYAGETFLRKTDAQTWALEAELAIDNDLPVPRRGDDRLRKAEPTLADLIDLHVDDMDELKRPIPRSKTFVLKTSGFYQARPPQSRSRCGDREIGQSNAGRRAARARS